MNIKKCNLKLVFFLFIALNIIVIVQFFNKNLHAEPPGNIVTCYCTLGVLQPGDVQYTVYDCGPCTKVNCSSYSDGLHCTYHASAENGNIPNA